MEFCHLTSEEALPHSNMSTPLERVQHLLVTPQNPPREIEELDFQRCVKLHNAILEHGWLSSGRSVEDFQSQCTPYYERAAEEIDEKCSASSKLSSKVLVMYRQESFASTSFTTFLG